MRKFLLSLLTLCFFLSLCGCEKQNPYLAYVSDLRQNVYAGTVNEIPVTAYYGFREEPFTPDGKTGEKVYGYTFKLSVVPSDVYRTLELNVGGEVLSSAFAADAVTGEYKTFIETETYFEKELTVTVISGSDKTPVTLYSILPENCMSYKRTLDVLSEKQQPLLNAYRDSDGFNAELYMRIFIKNDAPYWYVGIVDKSGKIKALVINGITGELLAVREIF